jgi:hypothetical protein
MAYQGTTALSSVSNPPILIARGLGGGFNVPTSAPIGSGLWFYGTTGSNTTDAFTASYFSDGQALGLKQGDVVIVVAQTSTVASSQTLLLGCISSMSSTGGTQLSTFSFISST